MAQKTADSALFWALKRHFSCVSTDFATISVAGRRLLPQKVDVTWVFHLGGTLWQRRLTLPPLLTAVYPPLTAVRHPSPPCPLTRSQVAHPCNPLHSWADGLLGGTPDGGPARPPLPPLPRWPVRLLLGQLVGLCGSHQTTTTTPLLLPATRPASDPLRPAGQPSQWVCLSLSSGASTGPHGPCSRPRGEDPPETPPKAMWQGRF
jgi:hypothetical protein